MENRSPACYLSLHRHHSAGSNEVQYKKIKCAMNGVRCCVKSVLMSLATIPSRTEFVLDVTRIVCYCTIP